MQFTKGNEIGRGGFGIVYEATDENGVPCAIKELNPSAFPPQDHPMLRRRFERGVRYQQMVEHPNVVSVIAANLEPGPINGIPIAARICFNLRKEEVSCAVTN